MADVIFTTAEGRPVNDDLRARVAGRVPALGLQSLIPFAGSLLRDPRYASAYYIAIDSMVDGQRQPFLLHLTLASAPSNPVYPKAILIGRLRPGGAREIVVDAVPFGPGDLDNVRLYVEKIENGFVSKPAGVQSALTVTVGEDMGRDLTAAFEAFRQLRKSTGANLASFRTFPHAGFAVAWAALRAGWRFGYSIESGVLAVGDPVPPECSTFRIDASESDPQAIRGYVSQFLKARRLADIDLVFRDPVSDLAARLAGFKAVGISPQVVSVAAGAGRAVELAPIIRAAGASMGITAAGLDTESARTVGRLAGRVRCRIETSEATAEEIVSLATQLRA